MDRSSSLLSERLLLMNGAAVREEACREEKLRLLRRRRAGFAGSDVDLVVWWLPLPLLPAALLPVSVESLPLLLFPPAVLGALLEFCLPPTHPLSSFKRKRQEFSQKKRRKKVRYNSSSLVEISNTTPHAHPNQAGCFDTCNPINPVGEAFNPDKSS